MADPSIQPRTIEEANRLTQLYQRRHELVNKLNESRLSLTLIRETMSRLTGNEGWVLVETLNCLIANVTENIGLTQELMSYVESEIYHILDDIEEYNRLTGAEE